MRGFSGKGRESTQKLKIAIQDENVDEIRRRKNQLQ